MGLGSAYKFVIERELVEWQSDKYVECVLSQQKHSFQFLMGIAFGLLLLSLFGILAYGKLCKAMMMVVCQKNKN